MHHSLSAAPFWITASRGQQSDPCSTCLHFLCHVCCCWRQHARQEQCGSHCGPSGGGCGGNRCHSCSHHSHFGEYPVHCVLSPIYYTIIAMTTTVLTRPIIRDSETVLPVEWTCVTAPHNCRLCLPVVCSEDCTSTAKSRESHL